MTAVTGFVAIVSLLLALATAGGTATPQAGTLCQPWTSGCGVDGEKTDKDHKGDDNTYNHNETLVRDTAPVK